MSNKYQKVFLFIFIVVMSITFLLQAAKVLHDGTYNDTDLNMIYNFLNNLDNEEINDYLTSNQVLQYSNDLEFCVEILDQVIQIFESREEYEKCQELLNKKIESQEIINIKQQKHESVKHP